ncbi:MAG: LCP family protein [Clostridia bacterium]|nr:LCP family protein [Clostridia bacterium]
MKRELLARRLILPILTAFLILAPLLGVAVVGEHRYEVRHPAYAKHMMARLLGEESAECDADNWESMEEIPVGGDGGVTNILVLGRDAAAGLTDVMMLVSLDADQHSLSILQLPRDTYANYTRNNYKKLNGAYRELGGAALAEFLSHHMGVDVDRYLCIDLAVFGEIVDTLGGVSINIPADMDYDDPTQSLHIHLDAGEQVLNGEQAQMFVRFRSGYTQADLGRMDAQKLFLAALAKQVKSTLTLGRAAELACSCFGKVKTNLSLRECISCARALMDVDLTAVSMSTLQGEAVKPKSGGAWYYILNREGAAEQLAQMFDQTGEFDPDRIFTNASRSEYQNIYLSSASRFAPKAHTAQDLLDGALAPARIS